MTIEDQLRSLINAELKSGQNSKSDIARLVGCHPTRINDFLAGRRGFVPELLHKIARVFDIQIELLTPDELAEVIRSRQKVIAGKKKS